MEPRPNTRIGFIQAKANGACCRQLVRVRTWQASSGSRLARGSHGWMPSCILSRRTRCLELASRPTQRLRLHWVCIPKVT